MVCDLLKNPTMLILIGLGLCFGLVAGDTAWAGAQVGTVTQIQGDVKLFTHPGKSVEGPPPHALYKGLYYSVQDAHIGDRLEKGYILRTMPGAKARVIYDNGDQIHVAPATAFAISWDKDASDGKPEMDLSYGGARGVIEKGGPRSHFTIRTKTAVMGVRGTDFFIGVDPVTGATETATLRGSVAVASASAPSSVPVEVKAGETASVAAPPPVPQEKYTAQEDETKPGAPPTPLPAAPAIEVRKASVQELHAIQKVSEVKAEPSAVATAPETAKVVAQLEAQAKVSTLKDIRLANPTLAAKLDHEPNGEVDIDALNKASVAVLVPAAPKLVASNTVITSVSEGPPVPSHVSITPVEEPVDNAPDSRRSGFRLLRGEVSALLVTQNGGNSQSVELTWAPRYQFGSWGWLGYKFGVSSLKGAGGQFAMLDEELAFGVRVYGSASVEVFLGGQQWTSNGGGFEQGANLVYFPEQRSFKLIERWYVGMVHVNAAGSTSTATSGADATEIRLGIGI